MTEAAPFALLALYAVVSLVHGRRTLRAEFAEREFWRDMARRELLMRGPDAEHWL